MKTTITTGRRRLAAATALVLVFAACSTAAPTASPVGSGPALSHPPTGVPSTPAPLLEADSASKIDAAEQAGSLDADTALLYRLYAALDYPSLPAEYQSTNPAAPEATTILGEISLRLPDLSADLQSNLAPFFMRPDEPASVWAKRMAPQGRAGGLAFAAVGLAAAGDCTTGPYFACADAGNTPIRVWYDISADGAAEQAAALAGEIDSSRMWTMEQTAMVGQTPCTDGDIAHNGGNSRLDIYVISTQTFAFDGRAADLTLPAEPNEKNMADGLAVPQAHDDCGSIPFLVLDGGLNFIDLKTSAAHELFHAFQFSFERVHEADHGWWKEATATWAEDLVYPIHNTERKRLRSYWSGVDGAEGPLDTYVYGQPPQYAAYIWPFYLRQKVGSTNGSVVGQIWQAAETDDPLDVISKLEKWHEKWKEFALWNWNRDDPKLTGYRDNGEVIPKTELYQLTTCMSELAADVCERRSDESHWSVLANGSHPFPVNLKYASVRYLAGRPDIDVEKLTFDLSSVRGSAGIGLQAVLYIGDPDSPSEIKIEDWSELEKREICLTDEDVQKIVLVVSNSNVGNVFDGIIPVEGRSSGCAGWRGTMSATMTWDRPESHGTATSTFEGLWAEDAEYGKTRCFYAHEGDCEVYYRADGVIKWTWDSHITGPNPTDVCNETTSGTVPTGMELHDDQQLLIVAPLGDGKFKYWGQGNFTTPDIKFKCMAYVGEGVYGPPYFFGLQEGAAAGNSSGGGNTCYANDWLVDTAANTISGGCFDFEYDYNAEHLDWDLHRVGPPPSPPGG